ncbi:MAG: GNAT family protein [Bacteroidia bacterium]|nr:GNAT family protein [Bacteroidia bacterium]
MSPVTLRNLLPEDAPVLSRYADNYRIWVNLSDRFPHPYTLEDAHAYIDAELQLAVPTRQAICWEGAFAGVAGVELYSGIRRASAQVGYWLAEPFWGNGIMSLALDQFCIWVFKTYPEIMRLYAGVFPYNPASMQVLRKCGFVQEGILRKALIKEGKLWDEHLFARLRPGLGEPSTT